MLFRIECKFVLAPYCAFNFCWWNNILFCQSRSENPDGIAVEEIK